MRRSKESRATKTLFGIGVLLIVLNFVLGKVALPLFVMDPTISIVIYLISWGMLIAGLLMCGKEGWYVAKRYFKRHEKSVLNRLLK
jgi:uncharacterized membrane protein